MLFSKPTDIKYSLGFTDLRFPTDDVALRSLLASHWLLFTRENSVQDMDQSETPLISVEPRHQFGIFWDES